MERNITRKSASRVHPSAHLIRVLVGEICTSPESVPNSTVFASLAESLSDSQLNLKPHALSSTGHSLVVRQFGPQVESCSICKDDISESSSLLPCSHYFHEDCLDEWFSSHSTCPICRKNIDYY